MKYVVLFALILSHYNAHGQAEDAVFHIEVSYFSKYQCPEEIMGEPKEIFQQSGTGFLWQNNYIITAYHVLAADCGGQIRVRDRKGKIYPARLVGGETLFDIAVLELLTTPLNNTKLAFAKTIEKNTAVQLLGYTKDNSDLIKMTAQIEKIDVQLPDCLGSHHLAVQVSSSLPQGFSGGPALIDGKIVGMMVASSHANNKGYLTASTELIRCASSIIKNEKVNRLFIGGIWGKSSKGEVLLLDLLPTAPASLNAFRGAILKKVNNNTVNGITGLRTILERLPQEPNLSLQLEFERSGGSNKLDLNTRLLQKQDFEYISDFFLENEYLPFTIKEDSKYVGGLTIDYFNDTSPSFQSIPGNIGFDVIGLPQSNSGIRCKDIFDLGLILKSFSATDCNLYFYFDNQKPKIVKMPELLIN